MVYRIGGEKEVIVFVGACGDRSYYRRGAENAELSSYCCHPERSEGSCLTGLEILRCAQDDKAKKTLRSLRLCGLNIDAAVGCPIPAFAGMTKEEGMTKEGQG